MVRTDNCGPFLLSIIRHSDLKQIDFTSVGAEHNITRHSAYCRFHEIKKTLKAEINGAAVTPTKVTKRKRGSPKAKKASKDKTEEILDSVEDFLQGNGAVENIKDEDKKAEKELEKEEDSQPLMKKAKVKRGGKAAKPKKEVVVDSDSYQE